MTKEERNRYYASREWALLKEQVKERADGICERCERRPIGQTHHLTYERFGHELLTDLQGQCDECHTFVSGKSNVDPTAFDATGIVPCDISTSQPQRCFMTVILAYACGLLHQQPDNPHNGANFSITRMEISLVTLHVFWERKPERFVRQTWCNAMRSISDAAGLLCSHIEHHWPNGKSCDEN